MWKLTVIAIVLLVLTWNAYAQDTCDVVPDDLWQAVETLCGATGSGDVCYAYSEVAARTHSSEFAFVDVGAVIPVDQLETLTLSPYDAVSVSS